MDRKQLNRYKKNRREINTLAEVINTLHDRLDEVPVVSGKVTKSSDDFPYIEEHVQIRMQEPKAATSLKTRIREKEKRIEQLTQENSEVERYIENMPEGTEKDIFEMIFLDGMKQREVAEYLGYTKGRVSQIISATIKD